MRKCDVCGCVPSTIYVVEIDSEVVNCCNDCVDKDDEIINTIDQ